MKYGVIGAKGKKVFAFSHITACMTPLPIYTPAKMIKEKHDA
jgi:hypothetical protein